MPTTKRRSSKKEVILTKAAQMFREKGFAATSMRDLAERVGIEAASLYNHIKSKNEILEAICFDVANRFMLKLEETEASDLPTIQKLENLMRFHIQEMIEHYEEVYVSDREWKHLNEPFLSNFRNQRRQYRRMFAAIIEKGITKGEIKKIDAPTAVIILLQSVSGIESWHRSQAKISAKDLENNMVTILIDGLRK
ncbi:MAG: TetR/AcrR family transcriptional regulator [Chitinophagaceae bacterium]|nr:TetR/AcrR family transcriptional regulator [Chitinophagaceae bacterium]